MNHILLAIAALSKVTAIPAVTTICSIATYDDGVADSIFNRPFSSVMAAGSAASSAFALASDQPLQLVQSIRTYATFIRTFLIPVTNVASINNGDAADIIAVNAQLVDILDTLAHTSMTLPSPATLGFTLSSLRISVNAQYSAVSRLITAAGGASCDKQNSLNSIGSELSSVFNTLKVMSDYSAYLTASVSWYNVASVTCPLECATITLATTATSSDSSTTADTSASEIIGSRTVGGTVERCIVRPTSTASATTSTVTGV